MPVLLSEIINSNKKHGSNIKASNPGRNNYTMIDDLGSGLEPTPLTQYNSTDALTIETNLYKRAKNKLASNIPDDYFKNNNLSNFSPTLRNQFSNEPMREMSFQTDVVNNSKDFFPIMTEQMGAMEAGGVPMMKSAGGANDLNMQMNGGKSKEGFNQTYRYREHTRIGGQSCIDTLNHVMSCPMCARYFQCDNKVYNVIIIMLIVLFATIVYFLYREEKR